MAEISPGDVVLQPQSAAAAHRIARRDFMFAMYYERPSESQDLQMRSHIRIGDGKFSGLCHCRSRASCKSGAESEQARISAGRALDNLLHEWERPRLAFERFSAPRAGRTSRTTRTRSPRW